MARGRRNKPEIDICRVRTDRLRDMTPEQLDRAARRVGKLYEIPKKQQGKTKPRWLLSLFIANLRDAKTARDLDPQALEAYRRTYGKDSISTTEIVAGNRREADRNERLIWEMQMERGCAISGPEQVARDATREGRPQEVIDRIRGRRRPKIR
jgi:hypothetical protein